MKKLWNKIVMIVSAAFGGTRKFEKFLIENVDEGIEIVMKIRNTVSDPAVLSLASLLPGETAEAVLDRIAKTIDKVLDHLGQISGCLDITDTTERLRCYAAYLATLKQRSQEGEYAKFVAEYAKHKSG